MGRELAASLEESRAAVFAAVRPWEGAAGSLLASLETSRAEHARLSAELAELQARVRQL